MLREAGFSTIRALHQAGELTDREHDTNTGPVVGPAGKSAGGGRAFVMMAVAYWV